MSNKFWPFPYWFSSAPSLDWRFPPFASLSGCGSSGSSLSSPPSASPVFHTHGVLTLLLGWSSLWRRVFVQGSLWLSSSSQNSSRSSPYGKRRRRQRSGKKNCQKNRWDSDRTPYSSFLNPKRRIFWSPSLLWQLPAAGRQRGVRRDFLMPILSSSFNLSDKSYTFFDVWQFLPKGVHFYS